MKIDLKRAQLLYQTSLSFPAFAFAKDTTVTVEKVYRAFSGAFRGLSLSDISFANSNNLGEYTLRLLLFGGVGKIEFRLDGLRAEFDGLQSSGNVGIALESVRLAEGVLQEFSADIPTQGATATLNVWYNCENGMDGVIARLNAATPTFSLTEKFGGATQAQYSVGGLLTNVDEGWSYQFAVEPSVNVDLGHLYLSITARHLTGGKYSSLDERSAHFEQMAHTVLSTLDFQYDDADAHNEHAG